MQVEEPDKNKDNSDMTDINKEKTWKKTVLVLYIKIHQVYKAFIKFAETCLFPCTAETCLFPCTVMLRNNTLRRNRQHISSMYDNLKNHFEFL
jgi:hypothetical protein